MSEKKTERDQEPKDRDERVAIPLDPEEALKGLMQVDQTSRPATRDRASSPSDGKPAKSS